MAFEWFNLEQSRVLLEGRGRIRNLRREVVHGDSRFRSGAGSWNQDRTVTPAFARVKGVTLEENNVATHVPRTPHGAGGSNANRLARAVEERICGLCCALLIPDERKKAWFRPNDVTHHPAFGRALKNARAG